MAAQRLDKLIAASGRYSRREAGAVIRGGRVLVDGTICRDPTAKFDPAAVGITVEGTPISGEQTVLLMLHKPLGVVSATEDRTERTVLDLLPPSYGKQGVFPVGRLDKDTSGLLLLTNDGELGHRLTAPRHAVEKVYRAQIAGTLEPDAVQRFAQGLMLRDGTQCRPAKLDIETQAEGMTQALVTICEGKYHQVRRMVAACGGRVVGLTRLSEGGLTLDPALEPGQWRSLTEEEQKKLRHTVWG